MSRYRYFIDDPEGEMGAPLFATAEGQAWSGGGVPIATEDQLRQWVEAVDRTDAWPIVVQDGAMVLHRTDLVGEVGPDEEHEVWPETEEGSGLFLIQGWTWSAAQQCCDLDEGPGTHDVDYDEVYAYRLADGGLIDLCHSCHHNAKRSGAFD